MNKRSPKPLSLVPLTHHNRQKIYYTLFYHRGDGSPKENCGPNTFLRNPPPDSMSFLFRSILTSSLPSGKREKLASVRYERSFMRSVLMSSSDRQLSTVLN